MTTPLTPALLGKLIIEENPYTPPPITPPVTAMVATEPVEAQADLGTWQFKGVPYYIEKALKIPYTYTDASGHTIQDYVLVGYAGGGAY